MAREPTYEELEQKVKEFEQEHVKLTQTEERLLQESTMRAALLDNLPCVALILKKGTREIVASNQAAKQFGAVTGKTCYETCVQRDDNCPFCLAPELWATGEPQHLEVEYESTHYEGIWVPLTEELYVHYIFDITDRKKAEEALRQAHDDLEQRVEERTAELEKVNEQLKKEIDERKRIEEDLRSSEKRYRTVVEDQTEVISRFRVDGTFTFVNDVYCRFFGKSSKELLGKQWQPVAVSEDLAMIEEKLETLSEDNPIVIIENRVYSGSGEIRWMQFVNRGFWDNEGQLIEIQSVGRDINDRKLAEEALENAHKLLEQKVEQRTLELSVANEQLKSEIAERKQAEEELRESEERYYSVPIN